MSKLECEVISITGDHRHISLETAQPIPFALSPDEIEHRIVQAYIRLVLRADKARGSRSISVTRSGFLEVQMTEIPLDAFAPGMPLFMLEVFSLPSRSTVDSYGFFELDDTELAAAAEFVLGAAREAEERAAGALH